MLAHGLQIRASGKQTSPSWSELAELISMHPTHISRYERNLTSPTVDVVKRIADALKVSADELIYGDTQQKAKDKIQDNELLSMFSRVQTLKQDDINCIKSLINAYVLKTDLQQKLAL